MPLYEYECEACGRRFEMIQRFSDPPRETCLSCGGGPVRKLISSAAIQFKGTGWYVTDYAAKDKARASSDGESEKKPGESDKKSGGADKKAAAASGEPAKSSSSPESSSSTGSSDTPASSSKS